ncbi:MAG TPA: glycoside hydrolase [Candidatus Methylomirabilis sp.]|nr:glycoside hydrolase [Candidatus Methylomirabilis sp.]
MRTKRLSIVALGCLCLFFDAQTIRAQQYPESTYQEMRWRMIGPTRGGRTRAACGVPSQPNVFYIGQVNGGVWKTDDYGRTWTPIFDDQPTQAVGSIAVAPNPDIIYVGSGEGLARPDLGVGDGIYKSTDAGKTWTHLPGLRDGEGIPSLAVDPRDNNRVFAAVLGHPYGASEERGIYLTTDGGQNWQRVLSKGDTVGGSDVEIDPSNPDVVYAALWELRLGPWEDGNQYSGTNGGLFKSTDGGKNWTPLTNGLPKGVIQVNLTIAPTKTSRLFAAVASARGETGQGSEVGIYRSDDAGETWRRITTDPRPAGRIGGGDLPMPKLDTQNADVVYVTSTVTMKSVDGGNTWASFHGAPGGDDYQNLWINPNNPDTILLVSDQGAQVTVNGGKTWSSWYNQPTAQLYHAIASNGFPYLVCGGQQESGSVCVSSRGNDGEITFRDWHPVGVIEYGYAAPDPLNPDIIYGAGRREVSKYSLKTGQLQNVSPVPVGDPKYRADRTQPIMFSPVDPHVLFTTMNFVFKTTDGGHTWQIISPDLAREHNDVPASLGNTASRDPNAAKTRGVVYALAPSFKNVGTLWAGTDDGYIWITRDGGTNWKNITPPELTPWSKVSQITASHFDEEAAYASVSRFRIDDSKPYIYRTHDGGKSWKLITDGLPDSPVNTVREDPFRKGLLFAGTETSVWVSFDDGDHWQSLELNLPHSSMRDLWIHDDDLIVATHGRSFWVLDDITPLRQINEAMQKADAFLFKPAAAYRVQRDTNTDTPIPPDEPTAKNPPDGAIVDYFLAQDAQGPVKLEILDAQGKVVRRYASTDKPSPTEEEIAKQLIPPYWTRMPKALATSAGMHRFVWDLHYTTPLSTRYDYPIAAIPGDTPRLPVGPSALSGRYTVRLSVNGRSYSESLTVKMDPRVKTPAEGLAQMFHAQSRLAAMMTTSTEAVLQARSAREQLQKITAQASGTTADAIRDADKKIAGLLGAGGGFGAPAGGKPTLSRVNGEIGALYGEIGRGDATPTVAQMTALTESEKEFTGVTGQWKQFKATDLSALNEKLRAANLPEIKLESSSPEQSNDSEDVE